MVQRFDEIVIGSGAGGTPIAANFKKRYPGRSVAVLEKELRPAMHQSGRSTGVGHSGFNYDPEKDKLKARFCVEGNRSLREFCTINNVPFNMCGTLVVAQNEREVGELEKFLGYGKKSGVPDIRIITREELKEREPHARGIKALHSPTGFVYDPVVLINAMVEDARSLGVEYFFGTEVLDIRGNRIITNNGDFEAKHTTACAGLQSDRIAHKTGAGLEYSVMAIIGFYKKVDLQVNSMLYAVKKFAHLGVHITRTIYGDVIAGPTATLSFSGREDYGRLFTLEGFAELLHNKAAIRWLAQVFGDWEDQEAREMRSEIFDNIKLMISDRYFVKAISRIYDGHINPYTFKPYRPGKRAQVIRMDEKGCTMIEDFKILQAGSVTNIINYNTPGISSCLAFAPDYVENYGQNE